MPGMTTSVSSRSNGSGPVSAAMIASPGSAAAVTSNPARTRTRWAISRSTGSSSTSRMRPVRRPTGRGASAATAASRSRAREEEPERGSASRLGVDQDGALGLLDDAVGRGQAEAGSAPLALGREERLEDVVARLRRPCPGRCR